MILFLKRRWRLILLMSTAALAFAAFGRWREASQRGGQQRATPFQIAGNLYFVGANDVNAFLLAGMAGHILIDGGYPGMPQLIRASIAELGFDITYVRVLLKSEAHCDHAGGLAELQEESGAELWASAASADVLTAGGDDPDVALPIRALIWSVVVRYRAPRVDRRFRDGDTSAWGRRV